MIFVLEELKKISEKARDDEVVLAVMLFGSYARNEKFSDIDVCGFKTRQI